MEPTRTQRELAYYIESQPFFDSHSHMDGMDEGWPEDDRLDRRLTEVVLNDYVGYLAPACSAVDPAAVLAAIRAGDETAAGYEAVAPLLEACRATTTWRALREGIRALYPFEGEELDGYAWAKVDRQIRTAYRTEGARAVASRALESCNVCRQVHISQPAYVFDRTARPRILPSLVIDGFCFTGFAQAGGVRPWLAQRYRVRPGSLTDYLRACAAMLDDFVAHGGGSIKILAGYSRPLDFSEVDPVEAERLFPADSVTAPAPCPAALQDFLVRAFLEMAVARRLPLLVHTGYSNPLENARPGHLHRLFRSSRLKGLKVALAHGGWPEPGEALLMARTYPGCYLDLSWLPLLSTTESDRLLAAALDTVPLNKIMIGTDCGCPESFRGAVPLVRESLARVLAAKVDDGAFPPDTAKSAAAWTLHRTAESFFGDHSRQIGPP